MTAELAVAVPSLLLVLALGLSAVQLGVDRVRCADAAQVGVRLLARGESEAVARAAALRVAPGGAVVEVGGAGAQVEVTVRAPAPPLLGTLGAVPRVEAVVVARREDGWEVEP
ncbi:TadE family type IV pilus minor pilin [Arthrobacter sp. NEB 688]|uniref:TadE family type IV pilus minor pilin n=1 Tax=Arthrobacter sp. NEB 688 TaxID=904039 RepID=UPI00156763B9|nr:TadE family type IV pilus minor pilin [Arthrobacter sp. NEB 688]QKE83621.1 pilus assembly protein TadE [Arthrobacter sp. NEB 688]